MMNETPTRFICVWETIYRLISKGFSTNTYVALNSQS